MSTPKGRPPRLAPYGALNVTIPRDLLDAIRARLRNPLSEQVPNGALQSWVIRALRDALERGQQ
jgi:hypothetical protein